MDKLCGTFNYVAPEIIERESLFYEGEPVDMFAAGIVLFTMLSAMPLYAIEETCPNKSPIHNYHYKRFMHNPMAVARRRELKIAPTVLELIKDMIKSTPSERLKLE